MTVRTTVLQNRPEGLPAEELRLLASTFIPATAGGLHAYSGVLPAPAGYMGEVTLLGPEVIRVDPARWVIAGTQAGTQGDYVVTNDAPAERAIGARDATLTRVDRLVVQVRDTAYTPNDGVDEPDVRVIPGTPALGSAQPPDVPPNSLVLGTINVPPGSGTVTFTPLIVPTQVAAGGIAPVRAGETVADGAYDGQFHDHPTWGLRRWSTASGVWDDVVIDRLRFRNVNDLGPTTTAHPFQIGDDNVPNLAMDDDQIQARNGAGGVAGLHLNTETVGGAYGDVVIGPVTVFGPVDAGAAYKRLETPRLRITGTNDAQARNADNTGTPSTWHPFQIGPDTEQHVIIDTNEGMARTATGATGAKVAPFTWHGLTVNEPTADAEPVRRGTLNGNSGLANHTAWQNAGLSSSFAASSGGPGAKWIFMNGAVYLSFGLVRATSWPANTAILTWSTTYRPRYDTSFTAMSGGAPYGEVKIEASTGVMSIVPAGAAGGVFTFSGSFIPNVVF